MRSTVLTALAAIALAGCVNNAEIDQKISAGRASCNARFDAGELKTTRARSECLNDVERASIPPNLFTDLHAYRQALRISLAEKVDAGVMTDADAQLEFARINSDLTSEFIRRQQVDASVAAQRAAAVSQILSATRPTPSPSINCTSVRTGVFVNTNCY